jgi:cellulose synthase/poly-beta-1,6-N-acetylglucosamine synthase-like glycosyltransferase
VLLQILFWLFVLLVAYTYVGYPLIITLLARFRRRPVRTAPITPTASLIIPAYNEESVIAEKLDNSLGLDYPPDRLEVLVVSDGSTDRTNQIVQRYATKGIALSYEPPRRGKIAALNRVVPLTTGDVLVFTDANAMLESTALRFLVRNLADERVACVGGEKRVRPTAEATARGESAYWRYESYLKRCDSAAGSAMGVAGELFAVRRDRYIEVEQDSIIEDFVLSLRLVQVGWRVVYEPKAVAWERGSPSLSGEWLRRTRIAAGGFQAILRLGGMWNPRLGLPAFQYISHRALRWMAPLFMAAAFIVNLFLLSQPLYCWALAGQMLFYAAGLMGFLLVRAEKRCRPLYLIFYFCFANLAALVGFFRYITRSQPVTWKKARV